MTSLGFFRWPKRSTGFKLVDDSRWSEVQIINYYAVFVGYLSMALKGLRFLVITWTTVVLLGGFVSLLEKKDFWSLAAITLVQTAGIFDVVMNEKLSHMRNAFRGLRNSTEATATKDPPACLSRCDPMPYTVACDLLAYAKLAVQALVFIIILCPLAVVYIFGLPISAGISLWRLLEHDYGNTDEAANMKPALDVLYLLAVVQGALFCYRASYASASKDLVAKVAKVYNFKDTNLVWKYLRETRSGCEKDPSFACGRNLITYAMNQMDSLAPDNYISGVRILATVINEQKFYISVLSGRRQRELIGKQELIKHFLMGSASSGHMLHNLVRTLDSRSPHHIKTKKSAARIVAHIADGIRLQQIPRGIQCIDSLLNTSEGCQPIEPYELDRSIEKYKELWPVNSDELPRRDGYKGLVLHGLRILGKLATAGEENCRAISNTQGLLSRIMAPVTLDLLHNSDHDLWRYIVEESLKVLKQLTTAPGKTGKKLRRQIASNKDAIGSIQVILKCNHCPYFRRQLAAGILADLYLDDSTSIINSDTESRKNYVNTLLLIFAYALDSRTKELVVEKLATIASRNGSSVMVILNASDNVFDDLITMLLQGDKITYRISAAEILEQLCIHCIESNEHLDKRKKFKTDVLPKVLREILCRRQTEEHNTRPGAQNGRFAIQGTNVEGQTDDRNTAQARKKEREEHNYRKLLEALLSLSVSIFDELICSNQDLAHLYDAVGGGQFSLPRKLQEMVERNSERTMKCLKILKLIGVMVISMMKRTNFFVRAELDDLLDALSSASVNMKALEGSMIFEGGDDGTRKKRPFRTLASLVKEARDLAHINNAQGLGTGPVNNVPH